MNRAISGPLRPSKLAFLTILTALIVADQISKMFALHFASAAAVFAAEQDRSVGIALQIHRPGAFPLLTFFSAMALVTVAWMLPLPHTVKLLWGAAGLSNHIESLLCSGTVDFIAFRIGDRAYVGNIADLYYVAGVFLLAAWMVDLMLHTHDWSRPILADR